jgi:hypothetical protein
MSSLQWNRNTSGWWMNQPVNALEAGVHRHAALTLYVLL